jgi:hypothetical protein
MPYRDVEQQRRARRESAARARARLRAGSTGGDVEPAAPARLSPSPSDLYYVGQFLDCPRMPHEGYPAYHDRLRARWQELLAVLEGE